MTPELIGRRYRLPAEAGDARVAAGAIDTVGAIRAYDERAGADVVLERVPRPYGEEAGERFSREVADLVEKAAVLREHRHLEPVLDLVDDREHGLWLVKPLVSTFPIADALSGTDTVIDATRVAVGVLSGVAALHAADIVHGRVRPGSIQLTSNGEVRLADVLCGSIDRLRENYRHGDSSTAIVTNRGVDYLAPEAVTGGIPGTAGDLFGLGITLYELLQGRHPFRRGDLYATMYAIQHEEPPPPASSGKLATVVGELLEKDPCRRPTAETALKRLDAGTVGHS